MDICCVMFWEDDMYIAKRSCNYSLRFFAHRNVKPFRKLETSHLRRRPGPRIIGRYNQGYNKHSYKYGRLLVVIQQ